MKTVSSASADVREQPRQAPLRRLPVREDYAIRLIRLEEIVCALSREKRVYVRTGEVEHRTCYTLARLESLLPSEKFLRIHDSCIVNIEFLDQILFLGNHSYAIQLVNGLQLPVGRARFPELQRRLGLNDDCVPNAMDAS